MLKKTTKLVLGVLILALLVIDISQVSAQDQRKIVDALVEDGRFNTLVTAIRTTDLVNTLNDEGPFTILAPTDDAFVALQEATSEPVLANVPVLKDMLLYHVLSGEITSGDFATMTSSATALGQSVDINVEGDTVTVNQARFGIANSIQASNGIIYIIDTVLTPPANTVDSATSTDAPETLPVSGGYASDSLLLILVIMGVLMNGFGVALMLFSRPNQVAKTEYK